MVFGPNAIHDDRFTWEEVTPGNYDEQPEAIKERCAHVVAVQPDTGEDAHWRDFRLFKITGCAHKYRDQGVCDTCGDDQTTVTA